MIHSMLSVKLGLLLATAMTVAPGSPSSARIVAKESQQLQRTVRRAPAPATRFTPAPVRMNIGRRSTSSAASLPPRTPGTTETRQTKIVVRPVGSFGALNRGEVTVLRGGRVIASGPTYTPIELTTGAPIELRVRVTSLLDQPMVTVRGLSLAASATPATEVPLEVATGLVRVEASIDGRRVSGRARFHRIVDGRPAVEACASVGANGESTEISAGRYEVRLTRGSITLTDEVSVTSGAIRRVRLEG